MRVASVIRNNVRDRTSVNSLAACRRDELAVLVPTVDVVPVVLGFIDGLFLGTVLPRHGLLLRSTWSAVRTVLRKLCERVSVHTYDEGCTEAIARPHWYMATASIMRRIRHDGGD